VRVLGVGVRGGSTGCSDGGVWGRILGVGVRGVRLGAVMVVVV
jgi:hypothetical protein